MARGLRLVFGAFVIWGLFPLYWHALKAVPSIQIVAHRVVWCGVFVCGWLTLRHGVAWIIDTLRRPQVPWMLAASAALVTANWLLYIWAVNAGHVVETSLGYFLNPLVNVMLGVVVLRERLNPRQWCAVGLAAAGVLYLAVRAGAPPWIALGLALSFGTYGLVRKIANVEAVPGLGIETLYLLLPALVYLLVCARNGSGAFGHVPFEQEALLVAGGGVTAIPLIWFAQGARLIPYSLVGIAQYVAPTLQLASGVLVFDEPFPAVQRFGFALIWAALLVYAGDGLWRGRSRRAVRDPAVAAAASVPERASETV